METVFFLSFFLIVVVAIVPPCQDEKRSALLRDRFSASTKNLTRQGGSGIWKGESFPQKRLQIPFLF